MTDKIFKVALIGLGNRGAGLYREILKYREDCDFVAFCDTDEARVKKLADEVESEKGVRPAEYTDYKKCLDRPDLEAVIVASAWAAHTEICCYAMERGIAVGCEVGGAYSIKSLWDLVDCYKRTKTPLMMLENCCYGRMELLALKLKRMGLLGKIVHCEGGYRHDLRHEIAGGKDGSHYRFQEYLHRNCDNYPTHGLGPAAMLLDINRGNRLKSIYSVSTKAFGMKDYAERFDESIKGYDFNQGDVVTSVIKCENGETITLTFDTTLSRFYSRGFLVQGTKGLISEECNGAVIDDVIGCHAREKCVNNINELYEKYEHSCWKKTYELSNVHGGLDERVFDGFFDALKNGEPMPIDVYDMATWMSVSVLSETSLSTGASVEFPDFTDGEWVRRKNTFETEK